METVSATIRYPCGSLNASCHTLHCSSSFPPGCRGPGGGGDGGSGGSDDAAADMVSPSVSVVGVRASDNNGGGVGDDPVSKVGDGAG